MFYLRVEGLVSHPEEFRAYSWLCLEITLGYVQNVISIAGVWTRFAVCNKNAFIMVLLVVKCFILLLSFQKNVACYHNEHKLVLHTEFLGNQTNLRYIDANFGNYSTLFYSPSQYLFISSP